MTELDIGFHELDHAPPIGWEGYRQARHLPCAWDWSLMYRGTSDRATPHLAFTVRDGGSIVGIGAARLPGLRIGRGRPARGTLAGVLDVDCLVSSALPGIEVDGGPDGYEAALVALRRAVRSTFGRRVSGMLLRQVPIDLLPTAARFPSVVLEAPPVGRHTFAYETFDEYFASLSGSRRREFRNIERDQDIAVSFTARGDEPPELDIDAMLALVNATVRRYHRHRWMPMRLMSRTMLTAVLQHPEAEVITYVHRSGTLLGYGIVLGGGTWPVSWIVGFRPHGPGVRSGLWFHRELLYSKHWIEAGAPGYLSGAGTDEAKVGLGHQMAPVWSVLHPLAGSDTPRFLRTRRT